MRTHVNRAVKDEKQVSEIQAEARGDMYVHVLMRTQVKLAVEHGKQVSEIQTETRRDTYMNRCILN
jgi:hypothetical protein